MRAIRSGPGLLLIAAVLAVGAAVVLSGCSKKTSPPDVTGQTENGSRSSDTTGTGTGNPANPVDNTGASETDQGLKDIFFAFDDYSLSGDSRTALAQDAAYLKEMGGIRVTIEGHCDERGTVEYNLALGQRRADAARSYLIDLGVEGSRLSTISYGEERPFAEGHDESAWAQNRRAHFRVVNP